MAARPGLYGPPDPPPDDGARPGLSFGGAAARRIPPMARSLTVSRLYSVDRGEPAPGFLRSSSESSSFYHGYDPEGASPSSSEVGMSGGSGDTSASASPLSSRGWSPRNLQGSPLRHGRASPRAVDIVRGAREELEASLGQANKTSSPLGRPGPPASAQVELPPLPKAAMSTLAAMRTETSMLRRRVLSAPTSQDCALRGLFAHSQRRLRQDTRPRHRLLCRGRL